MTLQRMRAAAAALALAGVLGLAAPAHAARWERPAVTSSWIESALEWVARLWMGNEAVEPAPSLEKCSQGSDSVGCPPPPSDSDLGHGIDPNG